MKKARLSKEEIRAARDWSQGKPVGVECCDRVFPTAEEAGKHEQGDLPRECRWMPIVSWKALYVHTSAESDDRADALDQVDEAMTIFIASLVDLGLEVDTDAEWGSEDEGEED